MWVRTLALLNPAMNYLIYSARIGSSVRPVLGCMGRYASLQGQNIARQIMLRTKSLLKINI